MIGKKFIVITSVNPPTEAIAKFAALRDYTVVVVGDKKTPLSWHHPGVHFLDVETQQRDYEFFSATVPFNQYCRKMMGYLYAIANDAAVIVDTDDDNLPYDDWRFPPFTGMFPQLPTDNGFINIYAYYTQHNIWPRGLPFKYVKSRELVSPVMNTCHVGVWQGLVDLDPDVDAVYRLVAEHPDDFRFDVASNMVLNDGTFTPFNSQNTMFTRSCFGLLYLPVTVTFRFTDILRGLVAQLIMAMYDLHLGVTKATAYQIRNPHDLMDDFKDEISCYLYSEKVIDIVRRVISSSHTMLRNLHLAYQALAEECIVEPAEMDCLERWIKAVGAYAKRAPLEQPKD